MGRVIRPLGQLHSAKSLVQWGLIKSAQELRTDKYPDGLTCVYFNAEGQYDEFFTREFMGVDTDKLVVEDGSIIEEMTAKAEAYLDVAHIPCDRLDRQPHEPPGVRDRSAEGPEQDSSWNARSCLGPVRHSCGRADGQAREHDCRYRSGAREPELRQRGVFGVCDLGPQLRWISITVRPRISTSKQTDRFAGPPAEASLRDVGRRGRDRWFRDRY